MTIAVTGAGGRLGRRVAELLLADPSDPSDPPDAPGAVGPLGPPAEDVVLVTRRPAALADLAARGAADLAAALAAWAGRPVDLALVDDDAMAAHLVAAGLPADRAHLVATWHRAIREGWFAHCTDTVEQVTGHPARYVADLLPAAR